MVLAIPVLLLILLLPVPSSSNEFRVSPIRLILDKGTKSGVITIINEGDGPMQVQVMGYEWTQDVDGKDQYGPTNDLIYFPKLLKLDKGERRILRAGIKQPNRLSEKTYRLFIEEIPEAQQERKEGSVGVNILIRFGVPIFVKPIKEEVKGVIESINLAEGKLKIKVSNTGNSHFRIESIKIKGSDFNGTENFSQELSGWYLLAGVKRSYDTTLSQEICQDIAKIDVEVKTRQFMLHDQLDVIKTLCTP
jgi:fimbrial chaperone protein